MASLVLSKGDDVAAGRMKGATPTQLEPLNISWGSGAGTTAKTDVAAFAEGPETPVVGTSSLQTTVTANDTYQVTGTIVASAPRTVTNVVLKDAATLAASTTLSAAITTTGQTSITVVSATGFPGSGNYCIQIESEVLQVTAGQGTTTWTVTRGFNGSAAATHLISTVVTGGNNPGSTAVTAGSVFVKGDFTGISLNTGESIAFTVKVAYN